MKNTTEVCKKITITLTKEGNLYSSIEGTDIFSKFGKRKITNNKYIGSGDFTKNSLKELKRIFNSISKEKEFLEEICKLLEKKDIYLTTTRSVDNNFGIVGTQTFAKDILGNELEIGDVIGIYENNIRICESVIFCGMLQYWNLHNGEKKSIIIQITSPFGLIDRIALGNFKDGEFIFRGKTLKIIREKRHEEIEENTKIGNFTYMKEE